MKEIFRKYGSVYQYYMVQVTKLKLNYMVSDKLNFS